MLLAYARVSSLDQGAPEKVSIPEQLKRCRAIAELRGDKVDRYEFLTFVDRGVSGSVPLHKRPGGIDMLARAHKGDCIVAAKLDRIFRSAADALNTIEALKKKGIDLIIADIGIDPVAGEGVAKFFFSILAVTAQFERERIYERTQEGRRHKRARGGHTGGTAPFGYWIQGSGRSAILVRNEDEQRHMCRARALNNDCDRTIRQITALLEREGIVGRNGKPYSEMAVWRMLKGRRHGEDLVKMPHGAVRSEAACG